MMCTLRRATLLAAVHGRKREGVVRSPLALSRLRCLALWYAHASTTSLVGATRGRRGWMEILPDLAARVPLARQESCQASQPWVHITLRTDLERVDPAAHPATLWAGGMAA